MDDRRFDQTPEPDLDDLLSEGLSAPPPEHILREITPWRRAMNRILWGLVLGNITLNFWGLNYLLPAIGHVLILLGLRPLRRENTAFRVWWYTMLAETGLWAFSLIRKAAPGWQAFNQTAPGMVLIGAGLILELAGLLCLWQGLRSVRRGVGLEPGAGAALMLALWQVLLLLLAVSGMTEIGLLFFVIILIVYICIIRSLYKLSRELDEAGYALRPAPVRIPDWPLAGAIFGAVLLGIATVSLTFSRLPMDWQPVEQAEQDQAVQDVRDTLALMGFPQDVLADLADDDILACQDALRVVSDTHAFTLDGNYDRTGQGGPLTITGVAVELAGERETWRIFHHFQWDSGAPLYGTEAIQLWPAYHHADGWAKSGSASGRVLCRRDGVDLWAPYYFLGDETYTSTSMFFGSQTSTDLFASFSFPRDGDNCRGYVAYETAKAQETDYIIDSWINYVHCKRIFQYPAMTALEWRMTGAWGLDSEPFWTAQDAIQFYPWLVDEYGVF